MFEIFSIIALLVYLAAFTLAIWAAASKKPRYRQHCLNESFKRSKKNEDKDKDNATMA